MNSKALLIKYVLVANLKHIEGYSKKRALYLANKIQKEKIWNKPLCVDKNNYLVMDGQHRMEAAKILGLKYVPCWLLDYSEVKIWSLRSQYAFDVETLIFNALGNKPYPYKTVKHEFPNEIPKLKIPLQDLQDLQVDRIENFFERHLCE